MNSTVRQVTDMALAQLARFIGRRPIPFSELFPALAEAQCEAFAVAAMENPEYYLAQAIGILSGGAVDLKLLAAPLAECEAVVRLEIQNPGSSGYVQGERVTVITVMEHEVLNLPPRVRINDGVIQQVDVDLQGVLSLRVYYAERPPSYGVNDGDVPVRMVPYWDYLLALGLAQQILTRYQDVPDEGRAAGLAALSGQYQAELTRFRGHVRAFAPLTAYRSRRQAPRP